MCSGRSGEVSYMRHRLFAAHRAEKEPPPIGMLRPLATFPDPRTDHERVGEWGPPSSTKPAAPLVALRLRDGSSPVPGALLLLGPVDGAAQPKSSSIAVGAGRRDKLLELRSAPSCCIEALPAIALLTARIDAREGRLGGCIRGELLPSPPQSKASEGGDRAAIIGPKGAHAGGSRVPARGVFEPHGVFDLLLPPLLLDSAFLSDDGRGEGRGVSSN